MRGIADGVVGCSRCICFNDSNITGANWRLFVVVTWAQESCGGEEMNYVVRDINKFTYWDMNKPDLLYAVVC
jgi:hypothetical protein